MFDSSRILQNMLLLDGQVFIFDDLKPQRFVELVYATGTAYLKAFCYGFEILGIVQF